MVKVKVPCESSDGTKLWKGSIVALVLMFIAFVCVLRVLDYLVMFSDCVLLCLSFCVPIVTHYCAKFILISFHAFLALVYHWTSFFLISFACYIFLKLITYEHYCGGVGNNKQSLTVFLVCTSRIIGDRSKPHKYWLHSTCFCSRNAIVQ